MQLNHQCACLSGAGPYWALKCSLLSSYSANTQLYIPLVDCLFFFFIIKDDAH